MDLPKYIIFFTQIDVKCNSLQFLLTYVVSVGKYLPKSLFILNEPLAAGLMVFFPTANHNQVFLKRRRYKFQGSSKKKDAGFFSIRYIIIRRLCQ
jgi:hypothetical protein